MPWMSGPRPDLCALDVWTPSGSFRVLAVWTLSGPFCSLDALTSPGPLNLGGWELKVSRNWSGNLARF